MNSTLHKFELNVLRMIDRGLLRFFAVLISLTTTVSLNARELFIYETKKNPAEVDLILKSILEESDSGGYDTPAETGGFHSLYESAFFSPFDYKIFVGRISQDLPGSIVRVEASEGNGYILTRMLEMNDLIDASYLPDYPAGGDPRQVTKKSHLASQGLNLIAPWIGVFYNGYESPTLTSSQVKYRAAVYFLMDVFMVAAGGTNLFQEKFDASKHGDKIAAGLAMTRVFGSYQSWAGIQSNNQLVGLRYTFYFE